MPRTDLDIWKKRANVMAKFCMAAAVAFLGFAWYGQSAWPPSIKAGVFSLAAAAAYFLVIKDAYFFVVSQGGIRANQASVVIRLKLRDGEFGSEQERSAIHRATDRLVHVLDNSDFGFFDGDEYGQSECRLFMYGPDANKLFAYVERALHKDNLFDGAVVELYASGAKRPHQTLVLCNATNG